MTWTELKQKSATELQRLLHDQQDQLRDRRFKVAQGQHKDVREIRELKHAVARIQTRLQQLRTVTPTKS